MCNNNTNRLRQTSIFYANNTTLILYLDMRLLSSTLELWTIGIEKNDLTRYKNEWSMRVGEEMAHNKKNYVLAVQRTSVVLYIYRVLCRWTDTVFLLVWSIHFFIFNYTTLLLEIVIKNWDTLIKASHSPLSHCRTFTILQT